jgi:hypothetical protein
VVSHTWNTATYFYTSSLEPRGLHMHLLSFRRNSTLGKCGGLEQIVSTAQFFSNLMY